MYKEISIRALIGIMTQRLLYYVINVHLSFIVFISDSIFFQLLLWYDTFMKLFQ